MDTAVAEAARGLLVLADGAQAAFAAGAVAELERRGAVWSRGAGGGLGAHVGLLAVLGEAAEAERRWLRDAGLSSPLFRSRLAAARERAGSSPGVALSADAWTLDGWLDPGTLAEHLAPEMAAVPERLASLGRSFAVAVEELGTGACRWAELSGVDAGEAGALVLAAATFPGGWGPERAGDDPAAPCRWGGVGAAVSCPPPWAHGGGAWDVVCGFPVPVSLRPALGGSLLELVQRREEARAGAVVAEWSSGAASRLRLVAPTAEHYRACAERESAELGVEYPLPWERNGALAAGMVRFGAFVAGRA